MWRIVSARACPFPCGGSPVVPRRSENRRTPSSGPPVVSSDTARTAEAVGQRSGRAVMWTVSPLSYSAAAGQRRTCCLDSAAYIQRDFTNDLLLWK